jgi:hypothetical protein
MFFIASFHAEMCNDCGRGAIKNGTNGPSLVIAPEGQPMKRYEITIKKTERATVVVETESKLEARKVAASLFSSGKCRKYHSVNEDVHALPESLKFTPYQTFIQSEREIGDASPQIGQYILLKGGRGAVVKGFDEGLPDKLIIQAFKTEDDEDGNFNENTTVSYRNVKHFFSEEETKDLLKKLAEKGMTPP